MELSKRLAAVAAMVTPGSVVADVGCDHGYVSIYLVESQTIPKAIAMDVNRGPLEKAKEHIATHALSDYIDTRLSDGIAALSPGEADCLLCAGMGGRLIQRILTEGRDKLTSIQELILQPQSEIRQVRRFLRESGYIIVAENIIAEDGKFYPVMKAVRSQKEIMPEDGILQEVWDQYGKLLLEAQNTVLLDMLNLDYRNYTHILKELKNTQYGTERLSLRCSEIERRLDIIRAALGYFEVVC